MVRCGRNKLVGVPNLSIQDVGPNSKCLPTRCGKAIGDNELDTHRAAVAYFLAMNHPAPGDVNMIVDFHGFNIYPYQKIWLNQFFRHGEPEALLWASAFQEHRCDLRDKGQFDADAAFLPVPCPAARIHVVISNPKTNEVQQINSYSPSKTYWWDWTTRTPITARDSFVLGEDIFQDIFLLYKGQKDGFKWLHREQGISTKDALTSLLDARDKAASDQAARDRKVVRDRDQAGRDALDAKRATTEELDMVERGTRPTLRDEPVSSCDIVFGPYLVYILVLVAWLVILIHQFQIQDRGSKVGLPKHLLSNQWIDC